ncbi:inhibitor of growth protein 5-like protein [Lasius niger]|uniref:Inhibitor of growth protein 5-like protein n=1 Tax=Lasius niger TaxID=67767 RepID=A0A0J7L0U8_LASNI|nr:inhibitor of growth protein 5-like protein [Lasius niger]
MATSKEINSLRNYFTLDYDSIEIICDICTRSYDIEISTEEVKDHLDDVHNDYKGAVSSNTSEEDLKKYYEIQNNTIKCKFCDEKLYISSRTHTIIKFHLEDGHQIYEKTADEICDWLRERNYRLDESDENRCYECGNICKNKSLNIMNHLRNAHNVHVEGHMIPQRKSSSSGSLLNSEENVKDIATSSRDPQSGCSKSLDMDVDYDRDSRMKNVKRVKYDKCSSDELTSSSSKLLDFKYIEDMDDNEILHMFDDYDYGKDCDNLGMDTKKK